MKTSVSAECRHDSIRSGWRGRVVCCSKGCRRRPCRSGCSPSVTSRARSITRPSLLRLQRGRRFVCAVHRSDKPGFDADVQHTLRRWGSGSTVMRHNTRSFWCPRSSPPALSRGCRVVRLLPRCGVSWSGSRGLVPSRQKGGGRTTTHPTWCRRSWRRTSTRSPCSRQLRNSWPTMATPPASRCPRSGDPIRPRVKLGSQHLGSVTTSSPGVPCPIPALVPL